MDKNYTELKILVESFMGDRKLVSPFASEFLNKHTGHLFNVMLVVTLMSAYNLINSFVAAKSPLKIMIADSCLLFSFVALLWAMDTFRYNIFNNQKTSYEEWVWLKGRTFLIQFSFAISLFALQDLLRFEFLDSYDKYRLIASIILFFILSALLIIVYKPKLILYSSFAYFLTTVFVFGLFLNSLALIHSGSMLLKLGGVLNICLAIFLLLLNFYLKPSLNIVQIFVLHIVHPEKVKRAFASISQTIKNEIDALSYIQKQEKQDNFAYLLALEKALITRYSNKNMNKIGALLGALVVFILGATFEPFFQKILYEKQILPMICKYDVLKELFDCDKK